MTFDDQRAEKRGKKKIFKNGRETKDKEKGKKCRGKVTTSSTLPSLKAASSIQWQSYDGNKTWQRDKREMTGRDSSIFLSLFSNFLFMLDEKKRKTVTNGTLKRPEFLKSVYKTRRAGKWSQLKVNSYIHRRILGGGDLGGSQVLTQCSNNDSNGVRFLWTEYGTHSSNCLECNI